MRLTLTVLIFLPLVLLPVASTYGASTVACSIAGPRIHWIADYCMSKLQTDDEITASDCINEEILIAYPDECVAKYHYKGALCQLAISRNTQSGSIESCLNDKRFMGSTVRNKGIGN